jgi:hypothetical protein
MSRIIKIHGRTVKWIEDSWYRWDYKGRTLYGTYGEIEYYIYDSLSKKERIDADSDL